MDETDFSLCPACGRVHEVRAEESRRGLRSCRCGHHYGSGDSAELALSRDPAWAAASKHAPCEHASAPGGFVTVRVHSDRPELCTVTCEACGRSYERYTELGVYPIADSLARAFQLQRRLQARLNGGLVPDVAEDTQYVKDMFLALYDEVGEALRTTPWKPWKKEQELDRESLKDELVDVMHFFVNLCLAAGMSATELYRRFEGKNKENHERQDGGY